MGAEMNTEEIPLLEVEELKMHFPVRGGVFMKQVGAVKAVDGVSLSIRKGETLGLVGESGCGKSTLGKALVRLLKPTAGRIRFMGRDITTMSQFGLRPLRRIFRWSSRTRRSRWIRGCRWGRLFRSLW